MPERLECEVLQKARYTNTLTFTFTFIYHDSIQTKNHDIFDIFKISTFIIIFIIIIIIYLVF